MDQTVTLTGFQAVQANNNAKLQEIENFRNQPVSAKAQMIGFTAITISGLVVATVFALQIITGVFALAVTAATVGGLWYGIGFIKKADPLIQQKTKNFMLKKMVEEARKNAVSQLDNYVLSRQTKLTNSRGARDKMGNVVATMKTKISKLEEGSDARVQMDELLVRTETAYKSVCENIDNAGEALKTLNKKVQEYKDKDEIATLAGDAMAIFDNTTDGKLQEMLSLESFKSIDSAFNTAIISIENSARDMKIDNE